MVLATTLVGAPAAAALPTVTYGLSIGSCNIGGEAPPSITMRLIHEDASGHHLGRADIPVEADGDW